MARTLSAKPVVARMTADSLARASELSREGRQPTLAIIRVGENPDGLSYERGAAKRCAASGVAVESIVLPADCSQGDVMDAIARVNADPSVHGCLLLRPLPAGLDEDAACSALDPSKDVDGITSGSLLGVLTGGGGGFPPCTAEACLRILDHYGIGVAGKHVVVVGRSLVVGKPVSMMLQARDATVTMCHSRTRNLPGLCRSADILVVAAGCMRMIGPDCVRSGQVVVDVGINWDDAAGKLAGDVDFDAVEPLVDAITPVPGGVGAVTTAVLVAHVVQAAGRITP